jgi:signal transduction histidine kinase
VLAWRALALRSRLRAVGDAEHELRAAITAFGFALEGARCNPRGSQALAATLENELARAVSGLGDLAAARGGAHDRGRRISPVRLEPLVRSATQAWEPLARRAGRRVEIEWSAGEAVARVDRGRLSQALGNVISNAMQHGDGPVRLDARREGRAVTIEVTNAAAPVRRARANGGRGLAIAARAAAQAGGRFSFTPEGDRARAALVVPVDP